MTAGTKSPVSPVANHGDRRRALISGQGVAVLFVLAFAAFGFARYGSVTKTALGPEQVQCDTGISAASRAQVKAVSDVGSAPASALNVATSPGPSPQGMVWVPAGEFWMGSDEPSFRDARPWHKVYVDGFWMDKTEVTNAEFARFVRATGYVTVPERKPRAEDYPTVPPEDLVVGSVVFTPPNHPVELNNSLQWWSYIKEAN
jgi:sulfatase modifying factor 1